MYEVSSPTSEAIFVVSTTWYLWSDDVVRPDFFSDPPDEYVRRRRNQVPGPALVRAVARPCRSRKRARPDM